MFLQADEYKVNPPTLDGVAYAAKGIHVDAGRAVGSCEGQLGSGVAHPGHQDGTVHLARQLWKAAACNAYFATGGSGSKFTCATQRTQQLASSHVAGAMDLIQSQPPEPTLTSCPQEGTTKLTKL